MARHPIARLILVCSGVLGGVCTPAFAQCTDSDGDGFFYEAGCGTAEDCNDADADTYPGAADGL